MKIGVTGLDVIAGQGFLIVGPLGEGPLEDWCGLVPTGRRSAQAQRGCLIGDLQDRRAVMELTALKENKAQWDRQAAKVFRDQ